MSWFNEDVLGVLALMISDLVAVLYSYMRNASQKTVQENGDGSLAVLDVQRHDFEFFLKKLQNPLLLPRMGRTYRICFPGSGILGWTFFG